LGERAALDRSIDFRDAGITTSCDRGKLCEAHRRDGSLS
jgi:hypothetical protein